MRWLILLLVISCGKQQSPAVKDLEDFDGDLTVNHDEVSEVDRYIADVKGFTKIEGSMRFYEGESHDLRLTIDNVISEDVMNLLIDSKSPLKNSEYFSEWSRFRVQKKQINSKFTNDSYLIDLSFNLTEYLSLDLILSGDKSEKNLGVVKGNMATEISRKELEGLLSGKLFFRLAPSESISSVQVLKYNSIKNHTYRVFFQDAKAAKIFYVSKKFPITTFLETKKILSPRSIEKEDLYFAHSSTDIDQWWIRQINDTDYVISFTSLHKMSKAFYQLHAMVAGPAIRKNGSAQNTLIFSKTIESQIYFKFRGYQKLATFGDTFERHDQHYMVASPFGHLSGIPHVNQCTHHIRSIVNETIRAVSFQEILDSIIVSSQGKILSLTKQNSKIEEKRDEKGVFWDVRLLAPVTDIEISFRNADSSSYVRTGIYEVSCRRRKPYRDPENILTNIESEFRLDVQAFIEKPR